MDGSGPLLLTPVEAAKQLSIARSSLYELLLRGEIVSITIGRSRRIPIDALADFIDRKQREQGLDRPNPNAIRS